MALKSALLEMLSCMLSNSSEIRSLAEERRKALEVTDEYCPLLLEIMSQQDEAPEERKLATILLRQFIEANWKGSGDAIAIKGEIKNVIRAALPSALNYTASGIQNIVAQILCLMIGFEPNYWEEMTELILQKLKSSDFNEVTGSLTFLTELTQTDKEHKFDISVNIYETLYDICNNEHYPSDVRYVAVSLFTDMLNIYFIKQKSTEEILNKIYNVYSGILTKPNTNDGDYGLKIAVVDSLTFLCVTPDVFFAMVPRVLPMIWELLIRTSEEYCIILNSSALSTMHPESVSLFSSLIKSIFLLLKTVFIDEMPHIISEEWLSSVFYYIIIFLMITPELEEIWQNSADLYFNFVNDFSNEWSLRHSAKLLFDDIVKSYPQQHYMPAFMTAVTRTIQTTTLFSIHWWRINDSVMYCVGLLSKKIGELFKMNRSHYFLALRNTLHGWLDCMERCPNYIYLSRIIWVSGRYTYSFNPTQLRKLIYQCVNSITIEHPILQVATLKSIYYYTYHLETIKALPDYERLLNSSLEMVYKVAPRVNNEFFHIPLKIFISIYKQEPENLVLVNKNFGAVSLLIEGFHRLGFHGKINDEYMSLLRMICKNSVYLEDLKQKFLPDIINIILSRKCTTLQYHPSNVLITKFSLDILNILITESSLSLLSDFMHRGFLATCHCILVMKDTEINESGAVVLCSYLKLASGHMNYGNSEEYHILAKDVLKVVLSSLCPQQGRVNYKIGWLFVLAMDVFGVHLQGEIDKIIRTVLSRIQRLRDNELLEDATLIILAYLLLKCTSNVVNLLLIIPAPDGCSALNYVLDKWLDDEHCYNTYFERNISVMAIATFLKYAALSKDLRINEIYVHSSSRPIPVFAKGYSFIVNVLRQHFQPEQELLIEDSDSSSGVSSASNVCLVDFAKNHFMQNHAITHVDLKDYIMQFLREFQSVDIFRTVLEVIPDNVKSYLVAVGLLPAN